MSRDHDPLCPAERSNWDDGHPLASSGECRCDEYAHVRADEHASKCDHLLEAAALAAQVIHAEPVAARLVEVICEQDDEIRCWAGDCHDFKRERDAARAEADHWHAELLLRSTQLHNALTERDDARAEVVALREQMAHMYQAETFTDTDGYPSTRVFKAEVVGENEWAAHIRREVLADLRAKVEELQRTAGVDFDGPRCKKSSP